MSDPDKVLLGMLPELHTLEQRSKMAFETGPLLIPDGVGMGDVRAYLDALIDEAEASLSQHKGFRRGLLTMRIEITPYADPNWKNAKDFGS